MESERHPHREAISVASGGLCVLFDDPSLDPPAGSRKGGSRWDCGAGIAAVGGLAASPEWLDDGLTAEEELFGSRLLGTRLPSRGVQ